MFRSILLACLVSVALFSMPGCNRSAPAPVASSHTPEILIANRADKSEKASTVWVKNAQLNFPASLAKQPGKYWVIFVDQTPCNLGPDAANPLAYAGSPGKLPSCTISNDPPAGNRDRHYRYALWTEKLGRMPPYEQNYARATCQPVCP